MSAYRGNPAAPRQAIREFLISEPLGGWRRLAYCLCRTTFLRGATLEHHDPTSKSDSAGTLADIYVFSDLHLGEGWSPISRRHSRLEAFFYDQEFSNLLNYVVSRSAIDGRELRIVLNGDVFDFLAVSRLPNQEELRAEGFRLNHSEHKLGLEPTARKSAWKIAVIVRGHPVFFRALLRAVAAGARVCITRGNHDVELFWPEVRERFYSELQGQAEREGIGSSPGRALDMAALRGAVEFSDWFYYEQGRVYLEHGHQYEASNSFRYLLNPVLPANITGAEADTLDYPTGSHFVQHVVNRIKLVDPLSTYFVNRDRILGLLGRASLFDIARILWLQMPYMMRALRSARFFELHGMEDVAAVHRERVAQAGERAGWPPGRADALDALMVEPVGKTKYSLMQEVLRPVVRTFATVSAAVLLSVAAWFLVFHAIQSTGFVAGNLIIKASLTAILAVLSLLGVTYLFLRIYRRLAALPDPFSESYRARAEQVAALLDVPIVSFGHTHGPDLRPFRRRPGFYVNSGTWITNPSSWDLLKPKARQFTFVRIRDFEPELLRWDDSAGRWEVVPLLEDYTLSPLERLLREDDDEI